MNLFHAGLMCAVCALPSFAEMMAGTTFTYGGGMGGPSNSTMYGTDQTTTLKTWTGGGYAAHFSDSGTVFVQAGNSGSVSGCFGAAGYGSIKEMRWDGTEIRSISAAQMGGGMLHHAFTLTTRGTIMAIILEKYNGACGERIVEIDPKTSSVLWAWHTNDHLGAGNSAKLVASNQASDPFHINNADLNVATNQVVMSSHNTYEIYVVDRSPDSTAAKGAAGDILFRWGKPTNYGATGTTYIAGAVHSARWVRPGYPGEGNLVLYANNSPAYNNYPVGFEIQPVKNGSSFVKKSSGEFDATILFAGKGSATNFSNTGGMDKLPNGNWLVTYSNSKKAAEYNAGTVTQEFANAVKTWDGSAQNGIRRYSVCHKGLKKVAETDAAVAQIVAQCTTQDPVSVKAQARVITPSVAMQGQELHIANLDLNSQVRLMGIKGNVAFQGTSHDVTFTISMKDFKNGVYFIQGTTAGKNWTKQIVVAR